MKESQESIDLIFTEEDGDKPYYEKHYEGFDCPGGASGPTIAMGYDCGYVTHAEAFADWTGIVTEDVIAVIQSACGLTGGAAQDFVARHRRTVSISWDQAVKEFVDRETTKWERRIDAALPNTDKLSPNCYGAIFSLSYNRGCSYHLPGAHYAEMRAIFDHMKGQQFDKIPGEFLSMRRLWPEGGDLWRRRGHEAALFKRGLGPTFAQPTPPDHSTAALQGALNLLLALDPPLTVDGDFGGKTFAAVKQFQAKEGLELIDGVPGNKTWDAIDAALKGYQS